MSELVVWFSSRQGSIEAAIGIPHVPHSSAKPSNVDRLRTRQSDKGPWPTATPPDRPTCELAEIHITNP